MHFPCVNYKSKLPNCILEHVENSLTFIQLICLFKWHNIGIYRSNTNNVQVISIKKRDIALLQIHSFALFFFYSLLRILGLLWHEVTKQRETDNLKRGNTKYDINTRHQP